MMMITSNGKQPKEMTLQELKDEKVIQLWFARQCSRLANLQDFKYETEIKKIELADPIGKLKEQKRNGEITALQCKQKIAGANKHITAVNRMALKAIMLRNLEDALRLFVLELEDAMEYHKPRPKKYRWDRRTKHKTPYRWDIIKYKYRHYPTKQGKIAEQKKKLLKRYETIINRNGAVLQWDRRKLMLVAADRGYLTEMAVAYAIEECLEIPKMAVKRMLAEGKFTWGQVMVIGALFEMTPKEFCDTFMSGYFVEQGGIWRASFDNIDKDGLLSSAPSIHRKKTDDDGTITE